jgi:hypothetical protein
MFALTQSQDNHCLHWLSQRQSCWRIEGLKDWEDDRGWGLGLDESFFLNRLVPWTRRGISNYAKTRIWSCRVVYKNYLDRLIEFEDYTDPAYPLNILKCVVLWTHMVSKILGGHPPHPPPPPTLPPPSSPPTHTPVHRVCAPEPVFFNVYGAQEFIRALLRCILCYLAVRHSLQGSTPTSCPHPPPFLLRGHLSISWQET